jgi:hypothetical protein
MHHHRLLLLESPHINLDIMHSLVLDPSMVCREVLHLNAILEQLVELFQRTALHLGNKEVEEDGADEVGSGPDVAVSWALGRWY